MHPKCQDCKHRRNTHCHADLPPRRLESIDDCVRWHWQSASDGPDSQPRWISSAQLASDTRRLIPLLPPDTSAIVGVARSGLLPATLIAAQLHLPLYAVDQEGHRVYECGHGWRLRDRTTPRGPAVIVDDSVGSGRSLVMTRAVIRGQFDRPIVAAVYVNPRATVKPDVWAAECHLPHLFEWNLFNSIVAQPTAFDFDGILCHDSESGGRPGTPLYLPRRTPIDIITARPERSRAATLAWLELWGIRAASLTMGPWDEIPDFEQIACYKADAVRAFAARRHERPFGPPMFVESCPRQARAIADASGVLTVCPATGEVLGPEGCWL